MGTLLFWYIKVRKLFFFCHFFIRHFFLLFRISIFLLDNTKKVDLIEMGTWPGLRSIPHISGILLLMQLLLLQPLVDAKAETSAAVHARFEASPAKVTKVKGFSLRTAVSNRHIKYIFVEKNMDRDTAETACTLLNGTLATPSTYDEFDFLDSHMEQGQYHLGAQCKDCTGAEEDKWEWST